MTTTDDRYFSPEPNQRKLAKSLYEHITRLPLICPHGHVDPSLFVNANYGYGTPVDLLIKPDHYVFRMLYSHGIQLEDLGIPRQNGRAVETDHRKIWQTFADHFYLFRGTPTGIWLSDEFEHVFNIDEKLTSANAQAIYDAIQAKLQQPDFQPRRLFERFNIEVLATTDAATDTLEHHHAIRNSEWGGRVIPTFRPDDVVLVNRPGWHDNLNKLAELTGISIVDYISFIRAIEIRRDHFRELGAVATDHDVYQPQTLKLDQARAEALFQLLLKGQTQENDSAQFIAHMLTELARMSAEDGMVMQLHVGSFRNHNLHLLNTFGRDKGADIPHRQIDFTHGLHTLLNEHGNNPRLRLIVFTLDETAYSRELAPLAGHYPALFIGPTWWFHDSLNGMRRYFDQVMETAGIYNTVGFNDDTRAFPSIPARHDLWRRASADWLAGLLLRHIIDEN
ncbi:MAG TPA: glucuronate isomerase, partial [Elainellaceae cyanobacterium]